MIDPKLSYRNKNELLKVLRLNRSSNKLLHERVTFNKGKCKITIPVINDPVKGAWLNIVVTAKGSGRIEKYELDYNTPGLFEVALGHDQFFNIQKAARVLLQQSQCIDGYDAYLCNIKVFAIPKVQVGLVALIPTDQAESFWYITDLAKSNLILEGYFEHISADYDGDVLPCKRNLWVMYQLCTLNQKLRFTEANIQTAS